MSIDWMILSVRAATLLRRQKPIAASAFAWCPGGLTIAAPAFSFPCAT
jgi:hypothetical protein